jgi:hydrogenase expression/formation protein HypE
VQEETAAICAQFGADALALIGSGALLIATADPTRVLDAMAAAGVPAAVIGAFQPPAAPALLRRSGADMPLVPPVRDELWRILEEAGSG